MNIAVLGSNCKFSSDLAVKLNELKKSSLVYRYDALASFKKDIPLYKTLLNMNGNNAKKACAIDIDNDEIIVQEPIFRKIVDRSPLGQYIGDVETVFLDITTENKESDKIKTLRSMFEMLNTKVDNTLSYGDTCIRNKVLQSSLNNAVFSSNLLNIINVYSGIITKSMLNVLINVDPLTLIVKVKNDNCFLPCTIVDKELSELREKNPQIIILEVSSCDELFKNNFFLSTFGLNKEIIKEKQKEAVKEKPLENHRGILFNIAVANNVRPVDPDVRLLEMNMAA